MPKFNVILSIVLLSLAPSIAFGEVAVQREAQNIFDTTMSPFCPGRTISACPSEDARALREHIIGRLTAGLTTNEVRAELMQTYGKEVTGTPTSQGTAGKMFWLVPVGFLSLGVLAILGMFFSRTKIHAQGDTL